MSPVFISMLFTPVQMIISVNNVNVQHIFREKSLPLYMRDPQKIPRRFAPVAAKDPLSILHQEALKNPPALRAGFYSTPFVYYTKMPSRIVRRVAPDLYMNALCR